MRRNACSKSRSLGVDAPADTIDNRIFSNEINKVSTVSLSSVVAQHGEPYAETAVEGRSFVSRQFHEAYPLEIRQGLNRLEPLGVFV